MSLHRPTYEQKMTLKHISAAKTEEEKRTAQSCFTLHVGFCCHLWAQTIYQLLILSVGMWITEVLLLMRFEIFFHTQLQRNISLCRWIYAR